MTPNLDRLATGWLLLPAVILTFKLVIGDIEKAAAGLLTALLVTLTLLGLFYRTLGNLTTGLTLINESEIQAKIMKRVRNGARVGEVLTGVRPLRYVGILAIGTVTLLVKTISE